MPLTLQTLGLGQTAGDACYKFNSLGAPTGIYCNPLFQTSSASTINFWDAYFDITATMPLYPTYVSDGVIVRYFDGTNLGPASTIPCKKSQYVKGCCDNKLYKLSSGDEYVINTILIVPPYNFCYQVVEFNSQPFLILNDNVDISPVSPNNDCAYGECQPCPPPTTTTTTTSNIPIPGQTQNECGPITLLPLGVQCNVLNEPTEGMNNGILSVYITGGTAPYTVVWTLPNSSTITGSTIFNQPAGQYIVNVKDLWGDFTATTTCQLSGPIDCSFDGSVITFNTPTPQPTLPPEPPQPPQPTPILPTPPPTPEPTPQPTPLPQTSNITWVHNKECPNCLCAKTTGFIKLNGNTIYNFSTGVPCGTPTNAGNFLVTVGDIIDVELNALQPGGGCNLFAGSQIFIDISSGIYNDFVTSYDPNPTISYTLTVTSGNINSINSIEINSNCT